MCAGPHSVSIGDMIRKAPPRLESLVPYAVGHLATHESDEILVPEAVSTTSSVSGERFENVACVGKLFFVFVWKTLTNLWKTSTKIGYVACHAQAYSGRGAVAANRKKASM